MDELYPNLFVQYLYKECNEKQVLQVETLLQTNSKAKELLMQLQEAQALLNNCFPLLHPDKKSLNNIFRYAIK